MTEETPRDLAWRFIIQYPRPFTAEDAIENVDASERTIRSVLRIAVDTGLVETERTETGAIQYRPVLLGTGRHPTIDA